MNRYTLKVNVLDGSVTEDNLKVAIEDILLRLHPRITYHLGQTSVSASGNAILEMASDGEKDFLESHLKGIEAKLPVTVEYLGWGWIVSDNVGLPANQSSRPPHLAAIEPATGTVSFMLSGKAFVLGYFWEIILTIILIFLLFARIYLKKLLAIDFIYYVVFMLWLLSLYETPLDIRPYAKKIDCDLTELTVTYWFKKEAVQVSWESIWSLEYKRNTWLIHHNKEKPIRFLTRDKFKNKSILLKTIVQRASLNLVESGIGTSIYKRYEAP